MLSQSYWLRLLIELQSKFKFKLKEAKSSGSSKEPLTGISWQENGKRMARECQQQASHSDHFEVLSFYLNYGNAYQLNIN